MKTIIGTLLLLLNMSVFAQHLPQKDNHKTRHAELSQEQKKSLRLKKLTLALDLTNAQQKEMAAMIDEQMTSRTAWKNEMKAKRESGQKPSADDIFRHKSQMLDQRIAVNEKARNILNDKQFDTWKTLQSNEIKKHKGRTHRSKMQKNKRE